MYSGYKYSTSSFNPTKGDVAHSLCVTAQPQAPSLTLWMVSHFSQHWSSSITPSVTWVILPLVVISRLTAPFEKVVSPIGILFLSCHCPLIQHSGHRLLSVFLWRVDSPSLPHLDFLYLSRPSSSNNLLFRSARVYLSRRFYFSDWSK